MKKFLVLYKAPTSSFEQMKKATPEQQKAGMDAWMSWSKKTASSTVDMGGPLGKSLRVTKTAHPPDDQRPRRILGPPGGVEGGARRVDEGPPALHDAGRLHRDHRAHADPWHVILRGLAVRD